MFFGVLKGTMVTQQSYVEGKDGYPNITHFKKEPFLSFAQRKRRDIDTFYTSQFNNLVKYYEYKYATSLFGTKINGAFEVMGGFLNVEDFEAFPNLEPHTPRREKYFKAMKKSQQDSQGKVCIIPGIWGVFESVWQSFGFVNFSKMLTKHREIKKIFDDRGKFAIELTLY